MASGQSPENASNPAVKSIPTFARFGQLIFENGMHPSGTCCILNTVRRTETEKQKPPPVKQIFFLAEHPFFIPPPSGCSAISEDDITPVIIFNKCS